MSLLSLRLLSADWSRMKMSMRRTRKKTKMGTYRRPRNRPPRIDQDRLEYYEADSCYSQDGYLIWSTKAQTPQTSSANPFAQKTSTSLVNPFATKPTAVPSLQLLMEQSLKIAESMSESSAFDGEPDPDGVKRIVAGLVDLDRDGYR